MKRTLVVGLAVLTLLAGIDWSSPPARAGHDAETRPNILVIVADDQRAGGTLGVMPTVRQKLFERGLVFKKAFATSPLCCPSRAAIMTGRYPHNHEVRRNGMSWALDQDSTIQRYLQDAGYLTGLFGKYFIDWDVADPPPYFERYAFMPGSNERDNYYDGFWNVQGQVQQVPEYSTDFISDKTVEFLEHAEAEDDRPWLAWVAPLAPHRPYIPEDDYLSARVPTWDLPPAVLEKDRSDKPWFVQETNVSLAYARSRRRKQLRALMSVDDLVSNLLDRLRLHDEAEDTLVLYTSDNGFMWADHKLKYKRYPYTPSVEVPLALRWPDHLEPGTRRDIVSLADVLPTVLEVTGTDPELEYPLDGRSLFSSQHRDRLLMEYLAAEGFPPNWASTRTKSYQYVEYYSDTGEVVAREYYDIKNDRAQLHNLLGDDTVANDPDVDYLAAQLEADRECEGDTCP